MARSHRLPEGQLSDPPKCPSTTEVKSKSEFYLRLSLILILYGVNFYDNIFSNINTNIAVVLGKSYGFYEPIAFTQNTDSDRNILCKIGNSGADTIL